MAIPKWSKHDLLATLTIVVGHEQQFVTTPRNIMINNSEYLRLAYESSGSDDDEPIEIPPELATTDTFLSFVEFCLKGSTTPGSNTLETATNYVEIIQLYALANFLGSATLANHCIDKMLDNYEASDEAPDAGDVGLAWALLTDKPACGLKKLLAELWAHSMKDSQVLNPYARLPADFVGMMFVAKGMDQPCSEKAWVYYEADAAEDGFELADNEGEEENGGD